MSARPAPPRTPIGPGSRWRSLTAGSTPLVLRRSWRDRGVVLLALAVTTLGAFVAVAGPREIDTTIDRAARWELAAGVTRPQVNLDLDVGNSRSQYSQGMDVKVLDGTAARLPEILESPVRGRVTAPEIFVASGTLSVDSVGSAPHDTVLRPKREDETSIAMLSKPETLVRLVEGSLPEQPVGAEAGRATAQVAVTRVAGKALGLSVGDYVSMSLRDTDLVVQIAGIVEPIDPTAPFWSSVPEAIHPTVVRVQGRADFTRAPLLTDPDGIEVITQLLGQPFAGVIHLPFDLDAFDATTAVQVPDAAAQMAAAPGVTVTYGAGIKHFDATTHTAISQTSIVLAGVIAMVAAVLALVARLLVKRRSVGLALERARGASVMAITGRLFAESVVVAGIGCGLGAALASPVPGGWQGSAIPLGIVGAVSAGAAPFLGLLGARGAWAGRRQPADQEDRDELQKWRRRRRIVLEAVAVVAAVAAATSLHGRGITLNRSSGVDPFMASAPVLLGLAAAVVVIRVFPWLLRPLAAVARRRRGALGLLATADGATALAVLPLLALTMGTAVGVSGALISSTVHAAQVQSSWEHVGADARVDGVFDQSHVAAVRAQPGVRAVATVLAREKTDLSLGATWSRVDVLALDRDYAALIAQTPLDPGGDLAALAAGATGQGVPAFIDPAYAAQVVTGEVSVMMGTFEAPITPVATVSHPTAFRWLGGPYLIADLPSLAKKDSAALTGPTAILVVGPGADAAVAAVFDSTETKISSRAEWLTATRGNALMGGTDRFFGIGTLLVGILGAIALGASVLANARERGRTLATVRTLGLGARSRWWLALAQLLPLVLAAVLAGSVAAVAIVTWLGNALGLEVLASSFEQPVITASPQVFWYVGAGAVVFTVIAVAIEVWAHRHENLSSILRLGDTQQ